MKIIPWFIHPQAIPGVYDFVLSDKYTRSYSILQNVLVLPSFLMGVEILKSNKTA